MDFKLTEEQKLIQNTAAQFVQRELLPREGAYLKQVELFLPPGDPPRRELDPVVREALARRAREAGLWALELPESAGGSAQAGIRSIFRRLSRSETISARMPRRPSASTVAAAARSSAAFSSALASRR